MIPEGYEMQTSFVRDFRIADAFGVSAVRDTYRRAYAEWKDNLLYMKELTMALNFACWRHFHLGNHELSRLYHDLYHECYDKCVRHFKGEALREYWEFLD